MFPSSPNSPSKTASPERRLDPQRYRSRRSSMRPTSTLGSSRDRSGRTDRWPQRPTVLRDPSLGAINGFLASTPDNSLLVVRLGLPGRGKHEGALGPGEWLVLSSRLRDAPLLPVRWPGSYLVIALDSEAGPMPLPDRLHSGDDPAIVAFAKAIVRMGSAPVRPSLAVCRAARRTLQLRLAQVLATPGDDQRGGLPPWQVQRIAAAVEAEPATRFSVASLAGMTGLSRFHFARAFAVTVGLTPMAFVRVRRLAMAETLLRQTRLDIDTVAERVGYASAAALTRAFRKEYGLSPAQARRHAQTEAD